MRFFQVIFLFAGLYGIVVLTPLYFLERRIGIDHPPAITHPEFYYGFIGVALACQVAFLIVAWDPLRYRAFMIPAILEKLSFAVPCTLLWWQGRLNSSTFAMSLIDGAFALLFAIAFWITSALPSPGSRT